MKKILGATFLVGTIAFAPVQAMDLRNGFGGPAGYGDLSQLPNDDDSSSQLNLPFTLDFLDTITARSGRTTTVISLSGVQFLPIRRAHSRFLVNR